MTARRSLLAAALAVVLGAMPFAAGPVRAEAPFITVASTTSTEQSGLFGHLLPAFTKATGIEVRVVAVGTGQALKIGERGDADVLLVHDRQAELKFVADGWGVGRHDLMYNDFIVVGPKADPAGVAGSKDAVAAFRKVADARAAFVTRGDDSGTNAAERRFWREAGIDPKAASSGSGQGADWYKDIGGGMGAALNTAAAMGAYTLSDRGTWLNFGNRRDLVVVVEGDQRLFNQYGVMLVNPARHPTVKADLGQRFINWLISPEGQATVVGYKINGEQLFFPDVDRPSL
jgi:tungstate transport system substrate-binding protein